MEDSRVKLQFAEAVASKNIFLGIVTKTAITMPVSDACNFTRKLYSAPEKATVVPSAQKAKWTRLWLSATKSLIQPMGITVGQETVDEDSLITNSA